MEYKYLLFDLDGTLTDPAEGITRSVSHALSRFGIRVEDRAALYPFIGPPLIDSFREFYGLSDTQAKVAVAAYREYFEDKGIFENKAYPGIGDLLSSLLASGYQIFLATSKPEVYARQILKHFSLDGYFHFIGGASFDESRSAKADVVRYVLDSNGISDSSQAVMIGDRRHDIEGARANGLNSIGVLWGYGSREELSAAGATHLAKNQEALAGLLHP